MGRLRLGLVRGGGVRVVGREGGRQGRRERESGGLALRRKEL